MRGDDLLEMVEVEGIVPGDNLDAFLTAGHGAAFGMTGSGKTHAMRYFATHVRRIVVVFNPEDEPLPGRRVQDVEALWQAISDRERKVNYVPPDGGDLVAHMEAIRVLLFRIGDSMRAKHGGKAAPPWCVLMADEVHLVSSKSDRDGPIHKLYKLARKRGVVFWAFSQEPSEVAHIVLTQPQIFILFEVKAFRVPYLEDFGLPMAKLWPHIQKQYHYAVVYKNRVALVDPLPV